MALLATDGVSLLSPEDKNQVAGLVDLVDQILGEDEHTLRGKIEAVTHRYKDAKLPRDMQPWVVYRESGDVETLLGYTEYGSCLSVRGLVSIGRNADHYANFVDRAHAIKNQVAMLVTKDVEMATHLTAAVQGDDQARDLLAQAVTEAKSCVSKINRGLGDATKLDLDLFKAIGSVMAFDGELFNRVGLATMIPLASAQNLDQRYRSEDPFPGLQYFKDLAGARAQVYQAHRDRVEQARVEHKLALELVTLAVSSQGESINYPERDSKEMTLELCRSLNQTMDLLDRGVL